VAVEDGSEGLEGPEHVAVPVAETAPALNPRQVRARRRRRRRQLGTLIFVLVAIGVFAAAYFAVAGGGDDSTNDAADGKTGQATTTVTVPFFGGYKVTTGVNVRQAPDTTAPPVATVEQGHDVTVVCAADGQPVTAANGQQSTKWLKVAGSWPLGYVSAVYVSTGDDLTSGKIPACPAS
jgi:hypothetical protein